MPATNETHAASSDAVKEAARLLHCSQTTSFARNRELAVPVCLEHSEMWTDRGCPAAARIADAVVRVDGPRIARLSESKLLADLGLPDFGGK